MVSQTTLRSRLLALATGAGLAAGLMGVTGAQAGQYQVGELDIFFDTTVSLGTSVRTASRNMDFVAEGNGGSRGRVLEMPIEEELKGTLSPGKLADITVLSRNIMTIPEEEILDTEVMYTIIAGKVVYSGN